MFDAILEILRFFVLLFVVVFLWRNAEKHVDTGNTGWKLIVAGFLFLLFATILDITDNFEVLNRYIIIGDTQTEAFLEKVIGYLGGFLLLALGLYRWIPSIDQMNQEINGRRVAESALFYSDAKYRGIFNESIAAIFMFDLDYKFIDSNQAGLDLLGYTRAELLNLTIADADPDPDDVIQAYKQLPGRGKITNYEHQMIRKDGKVITVLNNSRPLRDTGGIVDGIQCSILDITERIEAEAEKTRLQRELEQAHKMESLGHLSGGIAHEFNNLLNVIAGYNELALNISAAKDDPLLTSYLEYVKNAAESSASLVTQLLSFSRMDQVEVAPMALAPILKDNIEMIGAILPSSIELDVDIDDGLPAVMMNPSQFQQVLMNLCVNAHDAMDGEGKLGIHLGWFRVQGRVSSVSHKPVRGDWVELSITDTGSGIKADIIDNIFNPFFTTKEVGKGTGMGLSFVYGIMEKNNNHILVESEVGKGTTFRLLFSPVTEAIAENEVDNARATLLPRGHGENILVVDDKKSITNLISDILITYGYQPVVAMDGVQALALFKAEPEKFTMLITDQTMPRLSGIQLIDQLREIRPALPAILCTGFSDKINADDAKSRNIQYFSKPVNHGKLIHTIALMLNPE